MDSDIACPLCDCEITTLFFVDASFRIAANTSVKREYYRCGVCDLIFVPSIFHLNEVEEKKVYDKHINTPECQHYRAFLSRVYSPMLEHITSSCSGLDYGSGPGPALSVMFEERGHSMAIYDKIYASNQNVLQQKYDFITSTEVIEHLAQPKRTFDLLKQCCKPSTVLGFMTKLVTDEQDFSDWHYKRDPTHITFYSVNTLQWLSHYFNRSLRVVNSDTFILFPYF